jgi:hypothetical protein
MWASHGLINIERLSVNAKATTDAKKRADNDGRTSSAKRLSNVPFHTKTIEKIKEEAVAHHQATFLTNAHR